MVYFTTEINQRGGICLVLYQYGVFMFLSSHHANTGHYPKNVQLNKRPPVVE